MLGGSAPSQTSGAPYRTESASGPGGWPTPAQNELCNRSCGVYSLFPGPGDTPKTLYTPAAKNSSDFQDYVKTQKVPNTFFSKFFLTNGTPHFETTSHSGTQPEISCLELKPEGFGEVSIPTTEKSLEERNVSARKESKSKGLFSDVIIKSEVEEETKIKPENISVLDGHKAMEINSLGNKERKHDVPATKNERTNARVGDILTNEPDSTEFKNLNNAKTIQDVTEPEVENLVKEPTASEDKVVFSPATSFHSSDRSDSLTKEKCNIKVFDSLNESGGKSRTMTELSVEVEPVNDIFFRLADKKVSKGLNIECKSSPTLTKKPYIEPFKPSPTRTLPLSPQNGGCSRTTPVTFKHTSQQDTDAKSQNIHVEVPSLFIKKEPSDFQKNFNGSPFLSPAHLDNNFFSPGGMNVLDGQLMSPYSSSFESSSRQKESFLGSLNQNFINPSQPYLSPRLVTESPFLSPNVDIGRFGPFKNYPTLPKIGENYLMSENDGRVSEGVFLKSMGCLPLREDRQSDECRTFVNSTTVETEPKNKASEKTASNGLSVTPCQVAEVTSASSLLSPNHSTVNPLVVKQETTTSASSSGSSIPGTYIDQNKETAFMSSGQSTLVSSTVGVPSPIQRCQPRLNEIKISPNSVSSPPIIHRSEPPPSVDLPPNMGPAIFTGSMLGERSGNLITTWPTQTHNPTLWQYSAPIDYPPFPPVGFQLVRDPITGHLLLIPASNIEALQRALLWPSYQSTPPQMIIPPLSVQPSTPHLIVDTNGPPVDFLTSETIRHSGPQHRILIASDNFKKKTSPTVIKVEASDCSNSVVVTTCDSNSIYSKNPSTLSPVRETTLHSQTTSTSTETGRKSQATSPCLNSMLRSGSDSSISKDSEPCQLQITKTVTLQDASNQTDLHFESEVNEELSSVASKDKFKPYTKTTEQNVKLAKMQDVGTETVLTKDFEDDKSAVLREIYKKNEIEENLSINCSDVPDSLNIKKETVSPLQVDLSGLELLSNSIEQFVCDSKFKSSDAESTINVKDCVDDEQKDLSSDACEGAVLLQNLKNGFREIDESESHDESSKNLGGLGLLCALAEQRFKEEIGKEINDNDEVTLDYEEKSESIKEEIVKEISNDDCESEKFGKECDSESTCPIDEDLPILKKEVETINNEDTNSNYNEEIISDRQSNENEDDSSNPTSEIGKFSTKKGPGRPKKYKSNKKENSVLDSFLYCKSNRDSKEMSPPVLEKEGGDYFCSEKSNLSEDSLTMNCKEDAPPTLTPSTILDPVIKTMAGTLALTPCEVNLIALKINEDKMRKNEKDTETDSTDNETRKRKLSGVDNSFSSSKKRKVGRPKKHYLLNHNSMTETIVAKKPKTKSYLFQHSQTVENGNCLKTKSNEDIFDEMNLSEDVSEEENKSKKIRPKLKAEPTLKLWPLENEGNSERRKTIKKEDNNCKQKMKIQKKIVTEDKELNENLKTRGTKESTLPSCVLTAEHLKSDKFPIRTLTAMGGLFYAGQLSAIRAPDVYGITIDGERGNRPHIYSREEILKDSILEIRPEKTSYLLPGTRCCAYWSEQYRCLYPGTISTPASPDPDLDDKFVNVEFDDGDSGKINIEDIRLLPKDYPIVEYDPNPLQSLSKRKRRISGTSTESQSKENKSIEFSSSDKNDNIKNKSYTKSELSEESEPKKHIQSYESGSFLSLESERRHLKKKRREKLKRLQSLSIEGKKKHKKHKCSDEHRHHRHHKKHRKHKHKHGKRHNGDMNDEVKRVDETGNEISRKLKKTCKNKCKSSENSCKLSNKSKVIKPKKCKERTDSVESRSKMAAFLPARQLWGWSGKGYKRPGAKGRARKEFYKTIQRGKERISVGDCAVFLSTGRPDRPYIGRIESMWESWGTNMIVRVKWFYHPEETVGCPATLEYPGALFESPHVDENDVQTISHKCEVLPLKEYTSIIGDDPQRYETIYDNNDIYYLAGYYDPTNTTLKMEPGVK